MALTRFAFALLLLTGIHRVYFGYLESGLSAHFANGAYYTLLVIGVSGWISKVKLPKLNQRWAFAILCVGLAAFLAGRFAEVYSRVSLVLASLPPDSDQAYYYRMLQALHNGSFQAETYYYGLGYPILGLLAYPLFPRDPYLVVNLLSYAGFLFGIYSLLRKFIDSRWLCLGAVYLLGLCHFVIEFYAMPWTSSVVLTAYTWAVNIAISRRINLANGMILGLCTGLSFATRYVDVVLFIPLWFYWAWMAWRHPTLISKRTLIAGGTLAAILFGAVFVSHKHYFGHYLDTPYKWHQRPEGGSDQSLATYSQRLGIWPVLVHLHGSLIDPRSSSWDFEANKTTMVPVFMMNLLFFFAPLGLWVTYRRFSQYRGTWLALFAGIALFLGIYAVHPGSYPGCLQWGSAHYFRPLIPHLYLFSFLFFVWFVREPGFGKKYGPACLASFALLPVLSLATLWAKPEFKVQAQISSPKPGSEPGVEIVVEARNRFGAFIPASAIQEFTPVLNVESTTPEGKIEIRTIRLQRDEANPARWHLNYSPPNLASLRQLKFQSYNSTAVTIPCQSSAYSL